MTNKEQDIYHTALIQRLKNKVLGINGTYVRQFAAEIFEGKESETIKDHELSTCEDYSLFVSGELIYESEQVEIGQDWCEIRGHHTVYETQAYDNCIGWYLDIEAVDYITGERIMASYYDSYSQPKIR